MLQTLHPPLKADWASLERQTGTGIALPVSITAPLADLTNLSPRITRQFGQDRWPPMEGNLMFDLLKEFGAYMSARKKWWLMPVLAILFAVGGILVLAKGSAVAPFIYTVF